MPPSILTTPANSTLVHQNGHSNGQKNGTAKPVHKSEDTSCNSIQKEPFRPQIKWPDLLVQIAIHTGFLYGLYLMLTFSIKFYTYLWCEFVRLLADDLEIDFFPVPLYPVVVLVYTSGFGITAGVSFTSDFL